MQQGMVDCNNLRMPSSMFISKLRAGVHSESRCFKLNALFGKAKAAAAYPLYSSVKSAVGTCSSRARRVSSNSASDSSNFEDGIPLSVSEAFSRAFATPSVFGPAWHSCSYQSWQLLNDGRITNNSGLAKAIFSGEQFENGRMERKDFLMKRIESNICKGPTADDTRIVHHSAAFNIFQLRSNFSENPEVENDAAVDRVLDTVSKEVELATPSLALDCENDSDSSNCSEGTSGQSKPLTLVSGAFYMPHPDKEAKGGEDAHFICPNEKVVGVADGVGGWADVGVDAGEYARQLMLQAVVAAQQEPDGLINPSRVLITAHANTKCRGSSTACILALCDNMLQAANIGDSGFIVVRNGKVVFKSPPQQHLFNVPYQLEDGGKSDPPTAAQVFSVEVAAGDVVVVGTDGLFDNVYDSEVTSGVMVWTKAGMGPHSTAEKLANLARTRAQDRNRETPFSTAAQDAGFRFYGGKMDDITVVVSFVTTDKQ